MNDARYEDLAARLESIVADLDELAFDELRAAMADGATRRPDRDRVLTRARRSVEKASGLLRQLADEPTGDADLADDTP